MISSTTTLRRIFTEAAFILILTASANGQVSFTSTDSTLENTFAWARDMALSYVHDGDDPVGLWYEAALPGRDAFCMRDLSHQVVAGAILGLGDYNANMLGKIAHGISESKDWCSFWEIDKNDRPAPCDYRNDKEFWYNLPANFDVVRACREAFLWSGDSSYVFAPEFTEFYRHTIHDYADRWNLTPDSIMQRRRFMNALEPFDRRNGFQTCRGLPSYAENFSGITVAIDLVGAAMCGHEAYGLLSRLRGDAPEEAFSCARAAKFFKLLEDTWWDDANDRYNTYYTENGEFHRGEGIPYLLLIEALRDNGRTKAAIADVLSRTWNVENMSTFPVFLYRNGYSSEAERILAQLMSEKRRDYPEVSFGIIEGIVCGTMGVRADASESKIITCHRAANPNAISSVKSLPFNGGSIDISHSGRTASTFTNHTAKPVRWEASFVGDGTLTTADGELLPSLLSQDTAGNAVSTAALIVAPGASESMHFIARE